MKNILGMILLALFCHVPFIASATQGKVVESKYFDKQMVYVDRLYVLNDILEFSIFDISKVEIVDESGSAEIKITGIEVGESETAAPQTQVASLSGKVEVQNALPEIPKYFYKNLKQQILDLDVPLTLIPKNPPEYARPIKLSVKLKKVYLAPVKIDNDGNYVQPLSMKIYAQLKEQKSGTVLTRYYDSASSEFLLGVGPEALQTALNKISHRLTRDLSLFLRSKY